jgi:hypothetical protein
LITRCNFSHFPNARIFTDKKWSNSEIPAQLKSVLDFASDIWQSNLQIMAMVTKLQTTPPHPDIRHTWFQEPIRFEDALGRIMPVPSEYNWSVSKFHRSSYIEKVEVDATLFWLSLFLHEV